MAIHDPRSIPGLVAWYSARAETGYVNDQQMTQWTDRSGNGNHAIAVGTEKPRFQIAGGPSGGGGQHIYFNSLLMAFELPANVMAAATEGEVATNFYLLTNRNQGWWESGTSPDPSRMGTGGTIYDSFGSTTRKTVGAEPAANWYRYSIRSAPNLWTTWMGSATATGLSPEKFTTTTNTVGWPTTIALGRSLGNMAWSGYFASYVLYNRVLTDTERLDLHNWLAANPSGGLVTEPPPPPPPTPPTPASDMFATPVVVEITDPAVAYQSEVLYGGGATTEAGEPADAETGASSQKSLWWTYTPTTSGTAIFDTMLSNRDPQGGGYIDTVLAIWTGSALNALTFVASDDEAGGNGTSRVTTSVTAGTTYRVQVGHYDASARLNYVLRVSGPATTAAGPPPESSPSSATGSLTLGVYTVATAAGGIALNGTAAALPLSSTGSITFSAVLDKGITSFGPITINVTADATLTVDVAWTVTARINVDAQVAFRFPSENPVIPVYRLLVVNRVGVAQTELSGATLGVIPWAVSGMTYFSFDVAADSEDAMWCQEARNEVQVWRNQRLLWQGPMVRVSNNGASINVQCADTRYYFTRRVIGRVPKQNLFVSRAPGEPANIEGWSYKSLPRSEETAAPAHSTTTADSYNDQAALRLSSSAGRESKTFSNDDWYDGTRLKAAGKQALRDLIAPIAGFTTNRPRLMIAVYDDNVLSREESDDRARDRAENVAEWVLDQYPKAKVTISSPAYRSPLNGNKTAPQRLANRRTVVSYKTVDGGKGHKQHATQSVTLRNPRPKERKQRVTFSAYVNIENEVGWAAGMKGIEVVRSDPKKKHPDKKWADKGYNKPLQTSMFPFGDGMQPGVWFRVQATVLLPNDGKKSHVEVRMFPPNGDALFSEMWLTREEALSFRHQEQADIIRSLVRHAQDETMGKSDLNIDTSISKTGIKRTRDYPFSERAEILSLLEEFPTLGDGMEWQIIPTGENRVFTTYFPRMGKDTTVILAAGSNVVSYGVDSDGTLLATTVVIQAPNGEGHSREERAVSDPTLMDGLVLEEVYTGTPNSPASSWRRQAERGLARYRRPVVIPSVTLDPSVTNELLESVSIGDRVTTDISDVVANIDVFQKARVTDITLDPLTDALSYGLTPEDINIEVLSSFGTSVKYFSQAQNPIVGASGTVPVESNTEFAARSFNDASWSSGAAGVGWVKEATGNILRNPQFTPATTVPTTNEVWIRKMVRCTGDMVLTVRAADWSYVYVNGNRVGRSHFDGYNVNGRATYVNLRIPAAWLDPSGNQLVAVHSQFDPARRSGTEMDSLYADVQVRGTYNADEIT